MKLIIDDKKIACDTQLALKLVSTHDEYKQLVHQLFDVTKIYYGRSYDEYRLKAYNPDKIRALNKDEYKQLISIIDEAFNEAWGCEIQGTASCLQVTAYKDWLEARRYIIK